MDYIQIPINDNNTNELNRSRLTDFVAKMILTIIMVSLAIVIGFSVFIRVAVAYIDSTRIPDESKYFHNSVYADEDFDLIKYTGIPVSDNYGKQSGAPIHILEPKVSDAYYQWGDSPQKAGLNK